MKPACNARPGAPRERASRVWTLLALFAAGACGEEPSGPGPFGKWPATTVGLNQNYGGGALSAGDTLAFRFTARPDEWVTVFLWGDPGHERQRTVLEWYDPRGTRMDSIVARSSREGSVGSTSLLIESAGDHTLVVHGQTPSVAGRFDLRVASTRRDAFAVGDVIDWQNVRRSNEKSVFSFTGDAGEELRVFASWQTPYPSGDNLFVEIWDPTIAGTKDRIIGLADEPIILPRTDRYEIGVNGTTLVGLPYELNLYRVVRAPEHAPVEIVPGIVHEGEDLEHTGDIDEFVLPLETGIDYMVFMQALSGSVDSEIHLQIDAPANYSGFPFEGWGTGSVGTDADFPLMALSQGPVSVRESGRYPVTVDGTYWWQHDTGPYRFLVLPIDPAPEFLPPELTEGVLAVGEAIDHPGDVDHFRFSLDRERSIVRRVIAEGAPIWGTVLRADGVPYEPHGPHNDWITLPAGSYFLKVVGEPRSEGSYQVGYRELDEQPEDAAATLVIDGPPVSESVTHLDADLFTFSATAGQRLAATFEGKGAGMIQHPDGWPIAPLVYGRTPGFIVPVTGAYTVLVWATSVGWDATAHYTLGLVELDTEPESVTPVLQVGDSVVGERLDEPRDVDDFVLIGTPATDVELEVEWLEPAGKIEVAVIESDGSITPIAGAHPPYPVGRGTVRMPPSGEVRLRLSEGMPGTSSHPGAYVLRSRVVGG
jgi:hypothetical protein